MGIMQFFSEKLFLRAELWKSTPVTDLALYEICIKSIKKQIIE